MTKTRVLTLTALLAVGLLLSAAKPASAEIDVQAALDAIEDEHCIGEYWVPSPPRPSEVWPVTVRIDGDVAYAWIERLEKPKTRWVTFYTIAHKGEKAVMTTRFGYNADLMQANPGYLESQNKVFGEDWSKHAFGVDLHMVELKLPFKCVKVFEPDTPRKLAMIEAIQQSMARLLPFSRYAARLPERVRIVIANFNVDDGHTYVVVRETNQVYGVVLDTVSADIPVDATVQPFRAAEDQEQGHRHRHRARNPSP